MIGKEEAPSSEQSAQEVTSAVSSPSTSPKVTATEDIAPPRLTKAQLNKLVVRNSSSVVSRIYSIAGEQLKEENIRFSFLDGKATTLLGASGLAITATAALLGLLVKNNVDLPMTFRVTLALSIISAVVSSMTALACLLVKEHAVGVSEHTVFCKELLDKTDAAWAQTFEASPEDRDPDVDAEMVALRLYEQTLAVHYWTLCQNSFDENERKADIVATAQKFFMGFVVLMAIAAMFVLFTANGSKPAAPSFKPAPAVDAGSVF